MMVLAVFSPHNGNRSTSLPQTLSASAARSSLKFARHLPVHERRLKARARPVPGKTAVGSGFGSWFARSACPSAAIWAEEFCQQARRSRLGSGSKVLPHVSKPSGTSSSRQEVACWTRRKAKGLPLRRPTHGSTRQDAECRARRPSRLEQRETDGVTPLADYSRRLHR